MEMTTISTALTSIKTATEIARLIKSSDNSFDKAESKLKLAELMSALADARIEITEIQQVLVDKDLELKKLKLQLAEKEIFEWDMPYYWKKDSEYRDGPFCQHCYDKNGGKSRLQINGRVGLWLCTVCRSSFADKAYSP